MSCKKNNPENASVALLIFVTWLSAGLFLFPEKLFADDLLESLIAAFTVEGTNFEQKTEKADSVQMQQNLIFKVGNVSFEMVYVEKETLDMAITDRKNVPQASYYIGRTEVTQNLWKAVMGSNPSFFKGGQRPVEQVNREDCQIFINRLNVLLGKNFRLPTETEWEYAARGGQNTHGYKYAGSDDLGIVAWYGNNSGGSTHDVGTRKPNELGIYDMSGNVAEWCGDCDNNPQIARGGGWSHYARYCDVSCPYNSVSGCRCYYLGLRLVLSDL